MERTDPTSTPSLDNEADRIARLAAEIVGDGDRVPPGIDGRLMARFAAAWQLGYDWRLPASLKADWDARMLRWSEQGGDVDWWNESDRRIDRPAPFAFDPWRRAWSEADTETETANGYKPTPGVPATFSRLWSARSEHYYQHHGRQDAATLRLAALNDLCRDGSEIGTHARRVRALWLLREERAGRKPVEA